VKEKDAFGFEDADEMLSFYASVWEENKTVFGEILQAEDDEMEEDGFFGSCGEMSEDMMELYGQSDDEAEWTEEDAVDVDIEVCLSQKDRERLIENLEAVLVSPHGLRTYAAIIEKSCPNMMILQLVMTDPLLNTVIKEGFCSFPDYLLLHICFDLSAIFQIQLELWRSDVSPYWQTIFELDSESRKMWAIDNARN